MMLNRRFLFCFLLSVCMLTLSCANVAPRLQESGLNSAFSFPAEESFAAYIHETRIMIEKARVDLNDVNRETVLRANAPFEWKPDETTFPKTPQGKYKKGVLLIHGLSDSPYLIQPIARHLQSRGFLVRAILLPGHGTVPGDLLNVTYREWIKAASYGVRTLKADVENVYLGGFSTGGTLSVLHALQDREVKGLFLFAPALAVKEKLVVLAGILSGFTDWIGPPRDDVDYAKYESFTANAAYQIYQLTGEVDAGLDAGKRLRMPVFAAFSEDDLTVDASRTLDVLTRFATSDRNMVVLYTKNPSRIQGNNGGRILCENSYLPQMKIIDFSHISITIPPDDPHYGRKGGYRSCLHYLGDRGKRASCLREGDLWQGEITNANLDAMTLRRLSYNPLFPRLLEHLDHFLNNIEADRR